MDPALPSRSRHRISRPLAARTVVPAMLPSLSGLTGRLWRGMVTLLLSFAAAAAMAQQALVLNTGVREPYTTAARDGFVDQVVAETFRRIGIKAEVMVYEASERALVNANQGIDDGTALRIRGLEATYPNLVRIPEKLMDNDFVAYTLGKPFATGGWDSLKGREVGYILGWKIFEQNLGGDFQVTKVKDADQLFSLLKLGRAEIILYERWQGLSKARGAGIAVQVLEPPLARTEMFMYLHKRHAALVDRAAAALAEMKRDGTYARLEAATLKPLLPRK